MTDYDSGFTLSEYTTVVCQSVSGALHVLLFLALCLTRFHFAGIHYRCLSFSGEVIVALLLTMKAVSLS